MSRRRRIACLLAWTLIGSLSIAAVAVAAGGPAETDPAKAGPDFAVQGEYVGTLQSDSGPVKFGAQVIALGDGKFAGIAYEGGLPGDGWQRGDPIERGHGATVDGVTTLQGDGGLATIKDGVITLVDNNGQEVGQLKKVERKSPTLGAKPPAGATVMFDGSSADAFEGGKLVEGNLLKQGCHSKQKLGSHTMHIEFRTPFMPGSRGQGRGNSGVYMQSRYELQVLDSFGLAGLDNECGGIYKIAKPAVNMCLPPLSWQTYDIDFTTAQYDADGNKTQNARVTIRHNGVVIHDNLELPKHTPGRHAESPAPDGVFLQDHGNPVVFRNIWVVEK